MLYRYANKKLRENKTIGQLKVGDNAITEDSKKCDAFAEHFRSIYENPCDDSGYRFPDRTTQNLTYVDIIPLQ